MTKSWNAGAVRYRSQNKGAAPVLNNEVLWSSSDNSTVLMFGGETKFLPNPSQTNSTLSNKEVWQFKVNLNGDVSWSPFEMPQDSNIAQINRPSNAFGANLDNTEYFLGGYKNSHTLAETASLSNDVDIGGIASFNLSSTSWNNDTAPFDGGTDIVAAVPIFGSYGLLMMLRPESVGAGQDPAP
ncbi:uncharacterized protein KY384_006695 [Bacidia gigantensis]|uniref:uncharacterized protein n=1 Tax=Bacidia gigantensis TaxID=2732470 RepID=UPI001D05A91C|nr:uncharacterized protein KY384_006695 [Bacidia gigantensis]KAG8529006.1 hypothetical protein KY384_006695 [Bacidia gigantensis]